MAHALDRPGSGSESSIEFQTDTVPAQSSLPTQNTAPTTFHRRLLPVRIALSPAGSLVLPMQLPFCGFPYSSYQELHFCIFACSALHRYVDILAETCSVACGSFILRKKARKERCPSIKCLSGPRLAGPGTPGHALANCTDTVWGS